MTVASIVPFRHYCSQPAPCGPVVAPAQGAPVPKAAMVERLAVVVDGKIVHLCDSTEDVDTYCTRKGLTYSAQTNSIST